MIVLNSIKILILNKKYSTFDAYLKHLSNNVKNYFYFLLFIGLFSCDETSKPVVQEVVKPIIIEKFGYIFNDYTVIEDTVKKDETFGFLLDKHHVENPLINKIVNQSKATYNIARNLRVGKPYTVLASKDSLEKAQVFIYQPNKVEYVIFDFKDNVYSHIGRKHVKTVVKTAASEITSSLSNAIEVQKINYNLTYALSDKYEWKIDFYN